MIFSEDFDVFTHFGAERPLKFVQMLPQFAIIVVKICLYKPTAKPFLFLVELFKFFFGKFHSNVLLRYKAIKYATSFSILSRIYKTLGKI